LRIAVVEVLNRHTSRLLQGDLDQSDRNGTDTPRKSFGTKGGRRARLLQTYLSERLHVVRVGDVLRRLDTLRGVFLGNETDPGWLKELSESLGSVTRIHGDRLWSQCTSVIEAAQSRVDRLAAGNSWFDDTNADEDGPTSDVEAFWVWANLSELNAVLQHLLVLIQADPALPNASSISAWFRFASLQKFFQSVVTVSSIHCVAIDPSLTYPADFASS
jgi:hypothetical protein